MFQVLSLVLVPKQQFIKVSFFELINGTSQANRDKKTELIIFTTTLSISKILNQACYK